ncbi:MAG: type IX secretion system membrane protein PorP/SprF [Flavobacteriales bacterium]|nr:type IX secretion system membrane protein PorP/SprF [Flavobacteriales bacterium]
MKRALLSLFVLAGIAVHGQTTMRMNLHYRNMNFYNPASGFNDTSGTRLLSLYWKDKYIDNIVWDKPANVFLNGLVRHKNGRGFISGSYAFDGYSFYDRHTLSGGYTYDLPLGEHATLSAGARGVLNLDLVDWDKLHAAEGREGKTLFMNPDLDLGAQFRWKGLQMGYATRNLGENMTKVEGRVLLKNQRHHYLDVSYNFRLLANRKLTIAPYFLFYRERNRMTDIGLLFGWNERVTASVILRKEELRTIGTLGFSLKNGFQVGMAADRSGLESDVNVDVFLAYRF